MIREQCNRFILFAVDAVYYVYLENFTFDRLQIQFSLRILKNSVTLDKMVLRRTRSTFSRPLS